MNLIPDLGSLPGPAQKILGPTAPAPMRLMAAKGIIPGLKPADVLMVVALLGDNEDEKVRETARQTFANLPAPLLNGALSADLSFGLIYRLAEDYASNAEVVEKLLRLPSIESETLELLAERADERIGELVATNEQLMLRYPRAIEKLYMNKRVRMSTADRLLELAVRNDIELAIPAFKEASTAIRNELVSEPTPEPTFDDILFRETDEIAQRIKLEHDKDDTHALDDEGEEHVKEKFLPLHAQIAQMSVSQKIRAATLGTSAMRLMLVRDPNRLVASAAVRSPLMKENEAERISASRAVSEDVLRVIAMNREFTRHYQVKLNLVVNPRTPFSFASRMVPHLRDSDVRAIAKSKNVSGAVAQAVRHQLARKQQGKQK